MRWVEVDSGQSLRMLTAACFAYGVRYVLVRILQTLGQSNYSDMAPSPRRHNRNTVPYRNSSEMV